VPRQRRPSQNWSWGSKLSQLQNLEGGFVVFLLGGKNRNFGKVNGLKLQLSLQFIALFLVKKFRKRLLVKKKKNKGLEKDFSL